MLKLSYILSMLINGVAVAMFGIAWGLWLKDATTRRILSVRNWSDYKDLSDYYNDSYLYTYYVDVREHIRQALDYKFENLLYIDRYNSAINK